MRQEVHDTFAYVCANQTFAIDDLMKELARVRDNLLDAVRREIERASSDIAANNPALIPHDKTDLLIRIAEYHNAYLALKQKKEKGETEIVLNPGKNLTYQILAQANHEKMQYRLNPSRYQEKLQNE